MKGFSILNSSNAGVADQHRLSEVHSVSDKNISWLTQMTAADPVSNTNGQIRQLAVAVDGEHARLYERDLVQEVAVQLPRCHSHRDDLNAGRTQLGSDGRRLPLPNGRRPIGYYDSDPRRRRSSSGVRLEDLVANGVETCSEVIISTADVPDALDALLGLLVAVYGV